MKFILISLLVFCVLISCEVTYAQISREETKPKITGLCVEYDPNNFDPNNAAHWYHKAFELCQKPPKGIDLKAYVFEGAVLNPGLKQYLKKQKPVIDLLIKASKIRHCDWEHDRFKNIWFPSNGLNIKGTQVCFRLLLVDIYYIEENVTSIEILNRCQILSQFSKHLDTVNSGGSDYLLRLAVKGDILKYVHGYLKRHPNITSEELEVFNEFLRKQDVISIDEIFDDQIEFAKTALTKHTEQSLDNITAKILNFKGLEGRKEFFDRNLNFYKEHIANLRTTVKTFLVIKPSEILLLNQKLYDDSEFLVRKFANHSEDFQPTTEDYENLIKYGKSLFAMTHSLPLSQIFHVKAIVDTHRNVLLTAIPLLLEYHKTGKLSEEVLSNSPKDAFGNQLFELTKTETGFTLKSRSIDIKENKHRKYEFVLPMELR